MTKADKEGQRKAPILRFKGFTDDWEQRQLNDFGTFHKGKGFSKNDVSSLNGTPVILYGMLYTDFKTHYSVNNISSYINEFDEKNTIFSSGNEIIFPSSGETAVDIARSAAVQDSGIIIGGDLIILKVNSNTELKFIPLIFLNQKYKRKVASLAQGKSIVHIHTNDLKNLEILIPQKSEQTKISNLINYIEKLLALYERKIKALKKLKQAIFEILNSIPCKSNVYRISEIFEVTRGNVLSKKDISNKFNNMYPVYSSQTKNDGLLGYYSDYLFENSITWTTDGANAGTVNYRTGKFYCTNVCGVLLNSEGYCNEYTAEVIEKETPRFVSHVGNPKLMNNVMKQIKVKLPDIDTQQRYSNILLTFDSVCISFCNKLNDLNQIKSKLLNTMFI